MKEIYNEGRVVGLSAYELYVRQLIEHQPDATPPTESAWLTNMFGSGSAMILKIPAGTTAGVHDYSLPNNCTICAANTIVASVFNGECLWSTQSPFWAKAVTSYGGLILNNSTNYPTSTSVPHSDTYLDNEDEKKAIIGYLTILDGIVYQQGTWFDSDSGTPKKDLKDPTFSTDESTPAVIRLYMHRPLTHDVKILFTGFMDKEFTSALSGLGGSTDPLSNEYQNGGFLGPAIYPWANKIVFIYPNMAGALASTYNRTMPYSVSDTVTDDPIGSYAFDPDNITGEVFTNSLIDMKSADPNQYYTVNQYSDDRRVSIPVNTIEADSVQNNFSVLATWYPGMSVSRINSLKDSTDANKYFFPPALYGANITGEGATKLVPIDTAAPGTIKGFTDKQTAFAYTQQLQENYSFYYDRTNDDLYFMDSECNINNLAPIGTKISVEKKTSGDKQAYLLNMTSSGKTYKAISLSKNYNNDLPIDGQGETVTIPQNVVGPAWEDLLNSLAINGRLDILGANLRDLRSHLPNIEVTGDIKGKNIVGSGNATISGELSASGGNITNTLSVGTLSGTTGTFSNKLSCKELSINSIPISRDATGVLKIKSGIVVEGSIKDHHGNDLATMAGKISALEAEVTRLKSSKQDLLKFNGPTIAGGVDLKTFTSSNPYEVKKIGYVFTYASDGNNANTVYVKFGDGGWQGLFFSRYNDIHVSTLVLPGMKLYANQVPGSAVYHPLA